MTERDKARQQKLLEKEAILRDLREEKELEERINIYSKDEDCNTESENSNEVVHEQNENYVVPTKEEIKRSKVKKEYSKKRTDAIIVLAFIFVIFMCYEMHRLENLEPSSWLGPSILICLAICVKAYMKRAYQHDLLTMRVTQARGLSELKREFGEDFVYENIEDVNIDAS